MTFLGKIDSDGSAVGDAGHEPSGDAIAVSATIVRAPGGHLMCLAHVGGLVSVARVTSAICGSTQGCHGTWHCMTTKNGSIPPSKN